MLFQLQEATKYARADPDGRRNPRLAAIPADEAFGRISGALFGPGAAVADVQAAPGEPPPANHVILPAVDVFDGWQAFAVDRDHATRILFGRHPFARIVDVSVPRGTVDAVHEHTIARLDALYERAVARDGPV
ncbi:MAG: hypothetical protein R3F55_02910 [Alphaproteobacteria bacterium]